MIERINSGKSWTSEEDDSLKKAFRQHVSMFELADRHGRTGNALVSRLVKLGCLVTMGMGYHMIADTPTITMTELKNMEKE